MVKIRQRGARVQYDIRFLWPDGTEYRERRNAPVANKSGAKRWAEAREAALLAAGKPAAVAPVVIVEAPTLEAFWPRVVADHYRAERKKESTVNTVQTLYRVHLEPLFGGRRLSDISSSDVATLKGAMRGHAPKSVNNALSVLSRALRCAVEWGVIAGPLPRFGFLRIPPGARDWYELDDYRRLVDAAKACGRRKHLLVLLAGSAGLRRGEIMALKWSDLDLARRQIRVERAIWQGHEASPKGGRSRLVPMTTELHAALSAHRHLQGERVLYGDRVRSDGRPAELTNRTIRAWLAQAQKRAGLAPKGGIHVLRHTFCSHLAIAGAPAKAIQELAGHADLATTQRYMHLSPANRNEAMAALGRLYEVEEKKERVAR